VEIDGALRQVHGFGDLLGGFSMTEDYGVASRLSTMKSKIETRQYQSNLFDTATYSLSYAAKAPLV